MELAINVLRFVGFVVTLAGLWMVAGGMRVVVSGRIDERRRSTDSLKRGVPVLILGLLLLFGSSWISG